MYIPPTSNPHSSPLGENGISARTRVLNMLKELSPIMTMLENGQMPSSDEQAKITNSFNAMMQEFIPGLQQGHTAKVVPLDPHIGMIWQFLVTPITINNDQEQTGVLFPSISDSKNPVSLLLSKITLVCSELDDFAQSSSSLEQTVPWEPIETGSVAPPCPALKELSSIINNPSDKTDFLDTFTNQIEISSFVKTIVYFLDQIPSFNSIKIPNSSETFSKLLYQMNSNKMLCNPKNLNLICEALATAFK